MNFETTSSPPSEQLSSQEIRGSDAVFTPSPSQPQPHHQPLSPLQVRQQLDGITRVLGPENVSPETQQEITETISEEQRALQNSSEVSPAPDSSPPAATETDAATSQEPKNESENKIENPEELVALYKRRVGELADTLQPAIGRLRSISQNLNPRDITHGHLQTYLDQNLPSLGNSIRSLDEIARQITPERLADPQNEAQLLEVLTQYKGSLLRNSEEFLQHLQILQRRTERFLEENRRTFDRDHPIALSVRALQHIVSSAHDFSVQSPDR